MAQVVRRRAMSSDRAGESMERDDVKRRERGEDGQKRPRPVSLVRSMSVNVDSALAGEIFDHFCNAGTLKSILRSYRYLCEVLRLKPNQLPYFYPKLKTKLKTWKAQALWTKLDKRAAQKCYNRGKACQGTRVLVIGAGPCGLRTAIEAQLLGAKVVVVEKRDRYSRNNVLHLWPCNIHELRALGAKKFYGKFCAGSIDHISIRQLQCILLKVCLLLGVEIFEGVSFEDLIEPVDIETGWRAKVNPPEHPVSQYEFDVLIGADGKRNTLTGFKRKEFRGKLAIAITANFINKHSQAEGEVEEISGVAFIFNQKFFNDLNEELGISLENIVYYKDETHYFVMTAKKQSLLNKGVLLKNHPEPSALLAPDNISQEALFQYAREAADFATKGQLPHLDFAVNHFGKPDVAMFDFTSMYAADHSARVMERHGHRLLQCLVGDSLLEPFWPTGTGCPRGFFSAMDAMWLMKQMESGKMTVLECLAERESIYRILSQTTPANISKDFGSHSLDPTTRYGPLNLRLVLPFQITQCYDTDNPAHLQPQNVLQDSAPRKRRRKESHVNPGTLLTWLQKQVENYQLEISDMTTSFENGMAICAIIHRYRPDLIDYGSLDPQDIAVNNQLAFDILECDLGVPPLTTGQEVAINAEAGRPPDKLAMISYLTQIYELFRKEIPYTLQQEVEQECDDLDDSVYCHNHKAGREKKDERKAKRKEREKSQTIGQLVANDAIQRKKKRSLDNEEEDLPEEYKACRVSNKKRLAKLMERAALQEKKRQEKIENGEPIKNIKNEERYKIIEQQFMGGVKKAKESKSAKKPGDLKRAIGRIDSGDWNVRQIEEKLRESKKNGTMVEKVPKWSKEAFNDKLAKVKGNLEQAEDRKQNDIDASLAKLQKKLREGSTLETGERGANKVSALVGELSNKLQPARVQPELKREASNIWAPPSKPPGSGKSDNCLFCAKKVYVVERMSAEGKFFHRACFRCDYCNILLRLGSYVYHREGRFAGKFFCIPHSTENALEKYRFKKKIDEIHATEMRRKELAKREEKKKEKIKNALSPSNRDRLMEPDLIGRGTTPERVEYEASIDLSAEESGLEQIDEDEWTDRNFGNSTANDVNTSDDSISDLESDGEPCAQNEAERPLTADETRRLAREWRARYKGAQSEGSGSDYENRHPREVRYTDHEYEDDSSDCEDVVLEVPSLPGPKRAFCSKVRQRRPVSARVRRRRSSSTKGSSDDFSSDYTTTSDDSSSDESELRNLDEKFNKKNPFTVPKIIVQPNSPIPGTSTPKQMLSPSNSGTGIPEAKHVAQTVPLGPTPFGTALYQPSLSSLMKYQYKTPTMSSSANQQPTPQYRTLSGVLSNNLKKNWVTTAPQSGQTTRKVSQSEIDDRLKSLMDRLSSQQSLLKPAEKPSAQMQHYLESTNKPQERKLSDTRPYVSYKPSIPAVGNEKEPPEEKSPASDVKVEEDGISITVPDMKVNNEIEHDSDTIDSESDSSDSDSLTTEVDECENNVEHQLPEIKINLADSEDLTESFDTTPEKSDKKCDNKIGDDIEFIDDNVESPDEKSNSDEKSIDEEGSNNNHHVKNSKRNVPKRRPSLLKTVVSIKSDQPVTVVNYTETYDTETYNKELTNGEAEKEETCTENKDSSDKAEISLHNKHNEGQNVEENIHPEKEAETDKDTVETYNSGMDSSISIADASMGGMESSNGPVECFNSDLSVGQKGVEVNISDDKNETTSIQIPKKELDNTESMNTDECGNLLIVCTNAVPQQDGENETSTEPAEKSEEKEEKLNDISEIYRLTNANEKIERLGQYKQHQSNMIHDLIIGRTKQRKARQPRIIATTSTVPLPPKESPRKSEQILDNLGDFQMIDDEDATTGTLGDRNSREKSLSRSLREGSLSRSIRESSTPRSLREGSPKITLPPTPITNPEKFGITVAKDEKRKEYIKGSMNSLVSPSESNTSNDIDYHLDGINSTDSSAPVSPHKGLTSPTSPTNQTPGSKKNKGFMATVAGIFRTASPSPVSSPAHEKSVKREDSFLGRWSRKDNLKKKEDVNGKDLILRTASLSLQASHPSTPPVPLSRRIKLGSQPPQASEDSFSEEEDENLSIVKENGSDLPKQILDRLDKRMSKSGKKAAKHAGSARVRRAQEIQRELEEIEVECVTVEARGVKLEQVLREEADTGESMQQWYRLLGEKNRLVRREQELMVASKQLELEEQAEKLEMELGNGAGKVREGEILELLVEKAEQRELLSSMLARDKERYKQEDKDLEIKMAEQGIRLYTPVRNGSKQE